MLLSKNNKEPNITQLFQTTGKSGSLLSSFYEAHVTPKADKGDSKEKTNTGEPRYKCSSSGSGRAKPRGRPRGWPGTGPWVRLNELDPEGIQPNTLWTGKVTTQSDTWATGRLK